MNAFAKVLVVFVLLLSSAFAISQMMLYSKREKWREKYEETDTQLQAKKTQATELQEKFETTSRQLEQIKADRDTKLSERDTRIKELRGDIEDMKTQNENLQTLITKTGNTIENQEKEIQQKNQAIATLQQENEKSKGLLTQSKDTIKKLQDEAVAKEKQIDALDAKVAELTKGLKDAQTNAEHLRGQLAELERRGIHLPTKEVPLINAKVARVDNAIGTVVLNKGSKQDVKVGYPFTIYRGTEFVAKVYVMEVQEDLSVARVDKDLEFSPMQVGDSATTAIH